jgi:type IV pilus assembly protein PilM
MKADQLKEILARFQKKRAPTDVVGLDIEGAGIYAVRMRKTDAAISVLCADLLPPIAVSAASGAESVEVTPLALPSKFKTRYACLATAGESSVVKLLSFPGHFDEAAEAKVVENLGLDDPGKYRISYKLVTGSSAKEAKVLALALPEQEACIPPMLLPSGIPAPYSLEISGLASMTAFLHTLGDKSKEEVVGIMDFGSSVSTFALFNKGIIALFRRFDLGTGMLLEKVRESLGVDIETAEGIIADGAFDISQSVSEVMEPMIKQLMVSRDFVERRENCRVSKIYASGGLVVSHDSLEEMRLSLGIPVEIWDPFEGLTMAENALPEKFAGKKWKFAAAVGACLATLEET